MTKRMSAALLLALLLAACGNGGGGADTTSIDADALCVRADCGTKERLLKIPQAENIHFTPDGRLFVSGSSNVFEVTHPASGWTATPIFAGTHSFGGMAQRGDVLYVTCFSDGQLYATHLAGTPSLQPIHDLQMSSPNGMIDGPDGELYINNGPLSASAPDPRMVRLRLDPADPMHVVEQVDWIASGLQFPNGLARSGRSLFLTESTLVAPTLGLVKRVDINPDGSPSTPVTLFTFLSLPDDLSVAGDSLLVAYYATGQIGQFRLDGAPMGETGLLGFQNPSQVEAGRPPLFLPTDVVVTEEGLVQDDLTSIGDYLAVYHHN